MRRLIGMASLMAVTLCLVMGGMWLLLMPARPVRGQATVDAATLARVTLAHYAPFAVDPPGTSVTVHVQGGPVFTDVVFADKVTGLSLPAGTYTVEIIPTGELAPALTASVALSDDVDYTLAVIGGANGWPLELLVLPVDAPPLPGMAQVRLNHLSPSATTPSATAVDICTDGNVPIPGLTGLVYGQSTGFLPIPPGIVDLKVALTGSNCTVTVRDVPPIQLMPGQVVDLFGIGLIGDLGLPFAVDGNGLRARASLSHFAPFAAGVISTAVTVRVGGTDLITGFVFGQLTPYVDLPVGDLPVEIIPSGGITPVLTGTAVISSYLDFTFAVIGDGINQPLALQRFIDDNATPPPAGTGRIRLAHLAPIDANIVNTRVDICNTADKSLLVDDLAYGEAVVLSLTAGLQRVYVSAGALNCMLPLIDVPPFFVGDGQIANAYAVGNVILQPPRVVTLPDLTPRYQYLPQTLR